MYMGGFSTKEIDNLIKKIDSMIEYNTYKLPKNYNKSVDHPSHYNHGSRETIDDIKEHLTGSEWNAYEGVLMFNVYKYIDSTSYNCKRKEYLNKAAWYLNKLIDGVSE